ncbi:MAG: hypothetical protein AAFW81_06200 [Pseudomonadota bacterium]
MTRIRYIVAVGALICTAPAAHSQTDGEFAEPQIALPPVSEERVRPEIDIDPGDALQPPAPRLPLPPDALRPSEPGGKHVGRVWVTPVLIQKQGSGSPTAAGQVGAAQGAVVSVRGSSGAGAREQAAQADGDVGASREELNVSAQNLAAAVERQQQMEGKDGGRDAIQRSDSGKDLMAAKAEAEERRLCERKPRNFGERVFSFFGGSITEECPSSVRRRGTVRVGAAQALSVKNTLYFINLSATNPTTVEIVCRVRERSETIAVNVSVAPLDFGEWSPPCAGEQDYKFWCTLSSGETIAAHAVQTQQSGATQNLEYIDFFLMR